MREIDFRVEHDESPGMVAIELIDILKSLGVHIDDLSKDDEPCLVYKIYLPDKIPDECSSLIPGKGHVFVCSKCGKNLTEEDL